MTTLPCSRFVGECWKPKGMRFRYRGEALPLKTNGSSRCLTINEIRVWQGVEGYVDSPFDLMFTENDALLCAPLFAHNHNLGFLVALNQNKPSDFAASDTEALDIVAGQAAAAFENACLIEEFRSAYRD